MNPARLIVLLLWLSARWAGAQGLESLSPAFDAANKLYEQGRYSEAAAAYEKLLQTQPGSGSLHFNLGNAWFKGGQTGRAIAAWRQAERIEPRDPGVRFNLQFARKKVSGSEAASGSFRERTLAALTVNEWAVLTGVLFWACFGLLALREARPASRAALGPYALACGAAALLFGLCAAGAVAQSKTAAAVVVVPEAIARSGPLDEARVLHQFRDGIELMLLDRKEVAAGEQKQTWLRVRDAARREGWLKSDQVVVLSAGLPEAGR